MNKNTSTNQWHKYIRRDISPVLAHWTKPSRKETFSGEVISDYTAYDILEKILLEYTLLGGTGWIKGSFKCVCFTEAPINEMVSIFNYVYNDLTDNTIDYHPFGIAVKKNYLFDKGGRPVIYQTNNEYDELPIKLKWRHKIYEPSNNIDFTWEREWRVLADTFQLEPYEISIFVPNAGYHQKILNNTQIDSKFKNRIINLSTFGLQYEWQSPNGN